jgi:hypothetical protein
MTDGAEIAELVEVATQSTVSRTIVAETTCAGRSRRTVHGPLPPDRPSLS